MPMAAEDVRTISDESLANSACAGSAPAFEELVRRFQVPLMKFLERRFPSRRDAEDILQDTFLKVHQSLHLYRDEWKFRTWVFTIAYRIAISHGRRQVLPKTGMPAAEVADTGRRPADFAQESEQRERLWRTARDVLSEEQFTILWLHYAQDMPAADIGKIMNRTWVSVKTIMHRARKKLEPHVTPPAGARRGVPDGMKPKMIQQVTYEK